MRATEVLIIESRGPRDHFDGRQEGKTLQGMLDLADVRSKYLEVLTRDLLASALAEASRPSILYVHFSCHGNPHGFSLTDATFIDWAEFHGLAWPKLRGKCLVFSSCGVGRGVKELFTYHKSFCNAIVAPRRAITWAEGLVAYSAFYFRAMRHGSTKEDVCLMNHIVGRGSFVVHFADRGSATYVLGAKRAGQAL